MPFSVLLLTAASSKRSISGYRDSKVVMNGDLRPGEVVLFFQMDRARAGLNMHRDGVKCCDGLIFWSQDDEVKKKICLVEMKSNTLGDPADQLVDTRRHLEQILQNDCRFCNIQIKWMACIYHHSSSQAQVAGSRQKLKEARFDEIVVLHRERNDIGPFMRGEADSSTRNRNRR